MPDQEYTFGRHPSMYLPLHLIAKLQVLRGLLQDLRAGVSVGFYDLDIERDLTPALPKGQP